MKNSDSEYIEVKNMFNHGVVNAETVTKEKNDYQINLNNDVLFRKDPYFKSGTGLDNAAELFHAVNLDHKYQTFKS